MSGKGVPRAGAYSHNLNLLGHNNLTVIQECLQFTFSTYCDKHDGCNNIFNLEHVVNLVVNATRSGFNPR